MLTITDQPLHLGDMPNPVVPALARRRRQLGMLQQEVAVAAGVNPQAYSRFEGGHHSPTLRTLLAFCAALRMRLVALAEDDTVVALLDRLERQSAGRLDEIAAARREAAAVSASAAAAHAELDRLRAALTGALTELAAAHARAQRADAERAAAEETLTNVKVAAWEQGRQLTRAIEALDALARQPILGHDLIDAAREAIAGGGPQRAEVAA